MNDGLIGIIEEMERRGVAQSPSPPLSERIRAVDLAFSVLRPMLADSSDEVRRQAIQQLESEIMSNLTNYGNFTEAYACAEILSGILEIHPARVYNQG